MKRTFVLLAVLLLGPLLLFDSGSILRAAELKLASVFSDHMVLQRNEPVTVWGWEGGLTDGSWGTRAPQCFATGIGTTYPKTVTIDLKKPRPISLVILGVPEIGLTRKVAVSLSVDGIRYGEVGMHVFDQAKSQRAEIAFEDTQARFVHLNFMFTTEFEVYQSK